jgi:hypothetical protein
LDSSAYTAQHGHFPFVSFVTYNLHSCILACRLGLVIEGLAGIASAYRIFGRSIYLFIVGIDASGVLGIVCVGKGGGGVSTGEEGGGRERGAMR